MDFCQRTKLLVSFHHFRMSASGRPIYSLDIHPDGSRLATGGVIDTCGVVVLWNMAPIRDPTLESSDNSCLKLFQMDSHQGEAITKIPLLL